MRKRLSKRLDRILTAASSNGLRRQINDDFQYDKKKIKHIQFVLHNVNVSLGALVSALSRFSKLRGPAISPDGLLGGLGYIKSIKDVKESLYQIVRELSDMQDTLADELTNPRWGVASDAETKKLLKEKEEVEEKVEDMDEGVDDEDTGLDPDDVVTSKEIKVAMDLSKKAEECLSKAVRQELIRFGMEKIQ